MVKESIPEKLILHSRLSPGDVLTLTAAVESLHAAYPGRYQTDVRCSVSAIWEHNPHINKIPDGEGRKLDMAYSLINKSNQVLSHFLEGYTANLAEQLSIKLSLTTNRPCLYLSEDEKKWVNQIRDVYHHEMSGRDVPFWLVNAGVKSDYTAKQWPVEYYQEVVRKTCGKIQWVQIGAKEHDHPTISGALNLVGKTDHRQLIRLTYHARGGLGPVTYLQHLMAAWEKPYLCLLGGREPIPWVQYPQQTTFHTIGALPCCKNTACWKSRIVPGGGKQDHSLCERPILGFLRPVAKCMTMIQPEEVISVLERYTT